MRLSASNIAWDVAEDDEVAEVLYDAGIVCVDVAPGKYFSNPASASDREIAAVRRRWQERGFTVAGMQSLLFGTAGLNLFDHTDEAMLDRLGHVARIGAGLGAPSMTFGSPRQRDRGGLDDARATNIAMEFFGKLGDMAAAEGIVVCIEPNPVGYGCNFLTGTEETAAFVRGLGHSSVRLQLDVGAMAMNDEAPAATIAATAALIGHVHASEPGLVPLGVGGARHAEAAAALRVSRPDVTVTIEMTAPALECRSEAIARAASLAVQAYGDPPA